MSTAEITRRFDCFAASCEVRVGGEGTQRSAAEAVALAEQMLNEWDRRFSRFRHDSELSRLNANSAVEVPVSALMLRLAEAAALAGSISGGLVDSTLVSELEAAGYDSDLRETLTLDAALALAPPRRPAAGSRHGGWELLEVDRASGTLRRPPGVRLDSGGLAKGLFADVLAGFLAPHERFAVNCAGEVSVGGRGGAKRPVQVENPFDGSVLHTFELTRSGVATSGIGRRSWLDARGAPAHHLLDPSTGTPAYTGVVQVTALAPSAVMAEIQAKAALLSGPVKAHRWLRHGGVIVYDDGTHEVIEPPPAITLRRASDSIHPNHRRVLQHA